MNLNNNKHVVILGDTNSGKTNLIFRYLQNKGGKEDIQQWVADPKTGDFLISFASIDKCAHKNPVHSFNFFNLMNSEN